MAKPSDRPPSELSSSELRKLKCRHADINGTSPAMQDKNLTPESKKLIQSQASKKLTEQGWIDSKEETETPQNLLTKAVSILTLGLFNHG